MGLVLRVPVLRIRHHALWISAKAGFHAWKQDLDGDVLCHRTLWNVLEVAVVQGADRSVLLPPVFPASGERLQEHRLVGGTPLYMPQLQTGTDVVGAKHLDAVI